MKILITGSTGLIGSALIPHFLKKGHVVKPLVRIPSNDKDGIFWNPEEEKIDRDGLEGADAIIHLAGENIGKGRWTREKKKRIRDSRVKGTRLLAEALASLNSPPKILICASAVGYYGDRGDEILTEESPPGTGFLPEVCQEWEAASIPAEEKGIRVVRLRLGTVLSLKGGALPRMLFPFRLGLGGKLGSGRQWMSWIDLEDVVGIIDHVLAQPEFPAVANAVSPNPVTNAEFTRTLARVLHRPALFPVPAFALRLLFREMADALLFASARVIPPRLLKSGYVFLYPDLASSLYHILGWRRL